MAGSQQFDYYYLILAGWFPGGEWLRSNRHVASIARSFHASRYFLFGISQDFWFFCCLSVLNWGHKGDIMWIHYRPKKKTYIESGTCCHFDILSFWGVSLVSSSFLFSSLHLGQELKENEPPFQRWCQPENSDGINKSKIVKPSDFTKSTGKCRKASKHRQKLTLPDSTVYRTWTEGWHTHETRLSWGSSRFRS